MTLSGLLQRNTNIKAWDESLSAFGKSPKITLQTYINGYPVEYGDTMLNMLVTQWQVLTEAEVTSLQVFLTAGHAIPQPFTIKNLFEIKQDTLPLAISGTLPQKYSALSEHHLGSIVSEWYISNDGREEYIKIITQK